MPWRINFLASFYSYQLGCTFLIILVSGKAKSPSAYCVKNMLRNIPWKLKSICLQIWWGFPNLVSNISLMHSCMSVYSNQMHHEPAVHHTYNIVMWQQNSMLRFQHAAKLVPIYIATFSNRCTDKHDYALPLLLNYTSMIIYSCMHGLQRACWSSRRQYM